MVNSLGLIISQQLSKMYVNTVVTRVTSVNINFIQLLTVTSDSAPDISLLHALSAFIL